MHVLFLYYIYYNLLMIHYFVHRPELFYFKIKCYGFRCQKSNHTAKQ